ncbi:MAG TPA: hypothetical protein VI365_18080 [Trebonia sp.]
MGVDLGTVTRPGMPQASGAVRKADRLPVTHSRPPMHGPPGVRGASANGACANGAADGDPPTTRGGG